MQPLTLGAEAAEAATRAAHSRHIRLCAAQAADLIARHARPAGLHPFVCCCTAAPANACKARSSSSDPLSLLVLLAQARRSTS